ncbi:MAG: hypothetical protein ACP5HK_00965 [Acidilobus sp.]
MSYKSAAAVLVAALVVASALLGLHYLSRPSRRGELIVRAFYPGGDDPVQIGNASFSVWAWAPTPSGTQLIPVYNGTGPQAVINLSKLVGWAEDWMEYYGPAAVASFMPSIIVFVSYPVNLMNGSVEVVYQAFMQPLNLSAPSLGRAVLSAW